MEFEAVAVIQLEHLHPGYMASTRNIAGSSGKTSPMM
jgi:hypothetical protein